MPGDVIQAQYEQLDAVASRFGNQAKVCSAMQQQMMQGTQALQNGGWQGRGANAFFGEMNGKVFPAIRRLANALEEAQAVTFVIKSILQKAEEEAARPFKEGEKNRVPLKDSSGDKGGGSLWDKASGWVHGALDVAGFIPGLGAIPDGVNALIYLAEGNRIEAGISAVAMAPVFGDAAKAGKMGIKAGKELLEEGAEKVVKEGIEKSIQEGTEKVAKEGAENLSEAAAKQLSREERLTELATDPAHKGKLPSPKTLQEAEVGLQLENAGKLPGPITRDPSGAAEFIDKTGQKWDVKGFNSAFPPRKGGFSLERDVGKIEAEIAKGENVILDSTKLSPEHLQQLKEAIEARGLVDKILWYP